jgi:rubredoxin
MIRPVYSVSVNLTCKTIKKGVIMKKWRCTSCDYIYDPEQGDEEGGIGPGTSFEDLPEDWVCPVCGAAKAEFEKIA